MSTRGLIASLSISLTLVGYQESDTASAIEKGARDAAEATQDAIARALGEMEKPLMTLEGEFAAWKASSESFLQDASDEAKSKYQKLEAKLADELDARRADEAELGASRKLAVAWIEWKRSVNGKLSEPTDREKGDRSAGVMGPFLERREDREP